MKPGGVNKSFGRHRFAGLSIEQFTDSIPMHIGQPPIDAVVPKSEYSVIDSEQVQYRGVNIIAVSRIARRFVGPFLAFAVSHPARDAAAGQRRGERERIVVT